MMISRLLRDDNVIIASFSLGIGSFLYLFGRESAGMKYYIKFLQKYDAQNEPVPVKTVLKHRFDIVLEDLNISQWNRKFFDIFITNKLEPVSLGSTKIDNGIKIGLPEYFQHGTEEGIINTNILIDKQPVKWNTAEGEKFLKSLFLSQNAQQFIIAKTVVMCDSYYFLLNALLPTFVAFGWYGFSSRIYNKFKLSHRSDKYSVTLYLFSSLLFTGLYLFLRDGMRLQYDKVAEDKVYSLGQRYILGGIEYYSQIVERNKALRDLVKNGHKYYTVGGNSLSIWRADGLPETFKLQLAKEHLRKSEENEEAYKIPKVNPNPHPVM